MPFIRVQGQTIEVDPSEYYRYWYGYIQTLSDVVGYFSFFPSQNDYGERELVEGVSCLLNNLDTLEDAQLREQANVIIELLKPLPQTYQNMVIEVTTQLNIPNPQTSLGKRHLTMKWKKLIAGEAPTESMKQALKTLQEYANWYSHQTQEVRRYREKFQQRIETIVPEVKGKLRNP